MKSRKPSDRVADDPAGIQTGHLPTTSIPLYLLGRTSFENFFPIINNTELSTASLTALSYRTYSLSASPF